MISTTTTYYPLLWCCCYSTPHQHHTYVSCPSSPTNIILLLPMILLSVTSTWANKDTKWPSQTLSELTIPYQITPHQLSKAYTHSPSPHFKSVFLFYVLSQAPLFQSDLDPHDHHLVDWAGLRYIPIACSAMVDDVTSRFLDDVTITMILPPDNG